MKRSNPYVGDPLTKAAKAKGYKARSVFKLEELDRKFGLIKGGDRVLDLGCHPGSWLKYCAKRAGKKGRVVGVDLTPTEPPGPNVRTVVADVMELDEAGVFGQKFDVVLSDMAPQTMGHGPTDALRSQALAERAVDIGLRWLEPKGRLAVKVFVGGGEHGLLDMTRPHFDRVKFQKTPASRKRSREVYLIALGFRGN